MALLKFLRRPGSSTDTASAGASSAAEQAVQAARQQARRRLLGAVVLLGVGIIGFPLVFQTQPRPIPVDIPIEIPNRDKVAPMGAGASVAEAPAQLPPVQEPPVQVPPVLGEAPSGKAAPTAVAAEATKLATAPVEVEVLPPSRTEAVGPTGKETQKDTQKDAQKDAQKDTQRDTDKDRGRFVVQAGSYTDVDAVREVRNKLERMGLKTYTQAAVIEGVTRVRVRVGPFNSKQEAQDVQNKIKAAGVAASLLQL
jgi:DedD protein